MPVRDSAYSTYNACGTLVILKLITFHVSHTDCSYTWAYNMYVYAPEHTTDTFPIVSITRDIRTTNIHRTMYIVHYVTLVQKQRLRCVTFVCC